MFGTFFFFFSSQQVALEVLWRPGPGLEPGKGINYIPFSYSFSFPAFSSPLFSFFAFLARSFFLFLPPPSLFSFPFLLLLLSPFSLYVSLCASYLPPLTGFLLLCPFFCLLSASLLLLSSCTPWCLSLCLAICVPSTYSSLSWGGGGSGKGKSEEKTGPLNLGFLQRPFPEVSALRPVT